jgi:hypothetical protein
MHKPKRIVEEFEDLGPSFEFFTENFTRMIVTSYGSVDLDKVKRRLMSRNKDRINKQTESIMEDQERWDWLRKRTKDKVATPYTFDCPVSAKGY